MTKAEARRLAKSRIAKMSEAEKEWASGAITDALTSLDAFRKCKSPFVFLSSHEEPDTHEIVGLLLALEKNVSVPRVRGGEMDAVAITPYSDFRTNKWGILEPAGGRLAIDCDLAIVPMVAFDGLKRAGHGKGYYDKFFAEHPDCKKIGIAFDCQRVEGLECEAHDVMMDAVVTEKDIIPAPKVAVKNQFGGEECE